MSKIRSSSKEQKKKEIVFRDYWGTKNFALLGLGMLMILAGFIFMAQGSWDSNSSLNIAPILLFIAYVIVIPIAILKKND